jgi:hypothetical protein
MEKNMNRYLFTLATLLDYKSEVRNKYSPEMIISGLFNDNLTEMDWIITLAELELVYRFEIPDALYDRTDLALGEFADELSQLPIISEKQYPEFYDIKMGSMKLTKRYIELEGKTNEDTVQEMQMINNKFEELADRLNVLLSSSYNV